MGSGRSAKRRKAKQSAVAARVAASRRGREVPDGRTVGPSGRPSDVPPSSPGRADDVEGFLEFRRSRGRAPTLFAVGLGLASAVAILVWFQTGR